MQLLCHNGAYTGPYDAPAGPRAPEALAALLVAVGVAALFRQRQRRGAAAAAAAADAAADAAVAAPGADAPLELRLGAAPALTPGPKDERRRAALARFCADNAALSGDGAADPAAQALRVRAADLLAYVRGGQLEQGAAMPAAVRFLRLYLLLCVADKDLLDNVAATGRFKRAANAQTEWRRRDALRALVEGNLVALEAWPAGTPGSEEAARQLALLRIVCEALPPPQSWWQYVMSAVLD